MVNEIFRYTPALKDPQDLKKSLVGREKELERIFKTLKEGKDRKANQSFLFVGPRGIGKTHLLLLIYYGVKGTIKWDGFSKSLSEDWVPILFAEEEYRITSLIDLLLEVLERLRQVAPDEKLHQLKKRINKVSLPGEKEREEILEYLSKRSQETGKRFLLLIDNLHEMLPYFTEEDQGRLRDILMSKDTFMLIGAAPSLFDAIVEYGESFYNFFEIIWLQEIEDDLVKEVIKKRLMLDGKEELMEKLDKYEDRLKAINHLTGGNPRLILSLYKIFAEFKIIEVERNFIDLLDEMTPYFQDRMKELSPQQRKIVDSIALLDGPSTPTEIANFARLPVNATNTQLGRLKKRGFVKAIKVKNKKETLYDYDINERLFRFWRQMRVEAGRKRLRFIVKFIKIWFEPEELSERPTELFKKLQASISDSALDKVKEITDRLYYLQEASPSPIRETVHYQRVMSLARIGDLEDAEVEVEDLFSKAKSDNDEELLVYVYIEKAFVCSQKGELDEAIRCYQKAVEIKPDDYAAWGNMGIVHSWKGELNEAIQCYKRVMDIKPDDYKAWQNMGNAYRQKDELDEAIRCYQKAVEIKPDGYEAWFNMSIAYSEKGELDEAIRCYQAAIDIRPELPFAWSNLGVTYLRMGKSAEAIKSCTKALEHAEEDMIIVICLLHRSQAFMEQEEYSEAFEDANEAYSIALEMDKESMVQETAARAFGTGLELSKKRISSGNYEKAITHLKKALTYVSDASSDRTQELVGTYFKNLLENRDIELMKRTLQIIEESDQTDLIEFLKPYRKAIQFIETGDKSVLNRITPEIRELVDEIVEKLEED